MLSGKFIGSLMLMMGLYHCNIMEPKSKKL